MPGDALAIVIVTYNSTAEIGACLSSVLASGTVRSDGTSMPSNPEIVVVDNASTDGTVAFVRQRCPTVRIVEPGENVGFARASNLGAAAARGEYLLLLNPDTVMPAGALQALIGALHARPQAAVAGPRLVDAEGRPELSFGPPITPWGELAQKTLLSMYNRRVRFVERYVQRQTGTAGARAWVSGACLLIRRADWDAVGGMDERFFMYTEDVDLCARVRARGRAVWFAPEAVVRHLRGRSAARNPATERLRRSSHVAYYDKHLPSWAWLLRLYLRLTGRGAHG